MLANPLADGDGVLTCRETAIVAATGEQKLAGLPASYSEILAMACRVARELEPDGRPVFFWRTVSISV